MKEEKNLQTRRIVFRIAASLVLLGSIANAESSQSSVGRFEIWTGSIAHFSVTSMSGSINTQLNLLGSSLGSGLLVGVPNIAIGYHWKNGLEFILTPSLNLLIPAAGTSNQMTDGNTLVSRLTGGVAYNFSEAIESSFYLRVDSGVAVFTTGRLSATYYVGSLQVGKRIPLTESIALSPNFLVEYISSVPFNSLGLTLTPLQFSLFL